MNNQTVVYGKLVDFKKLTLTEIINRINMISYLIKNKNNNKYTIKQIEIYTQDKKFNNKLAYVIY